MNVSGFKPVTGRDIAALLHPRLAVLVTCCDKDGKPNVLTVAWHTPLSHWPPLVGISIAHARYSHLLLEEVDEFVINIAGVSLQAAVEACGRYTGELDDKFAIAGLKTQRAECVAPPVLADALGMLECKVVNRVETGDHTFYIGQVMAARAQVDSFNNAWEGQGSDAVLQCLQHDRYGVFVELNSNGRG